MSVKYSLTFAVLSGRRATGLNHGVLKIDRKLGNQQIGDMKTTLDLPGDMMKKIKIRAVREGRKLKDLVAEPLRIGMSMGNTKQPKPARPVIGKDKQTGLPVIVCKRRAPHGQDLTPDRIAEILLAQETEWHHAAGRH
jgi:hypothetical protein